MRNNRPVLVSLIILVAACVFAEPTRAQAPAGAQPMSALEKEADGPFRTSDWPTAAAAYEAVVKAEPGNGRAQFRLGMAHFHLKQYEKAAAALQNALRLKFAPVPGNYNLACAMARLGRKDEALAALQSAVQAGYGNLQQVQTDPDLASLRDDARFAALVTQMQRAARPCDFDDAYKQFDYWVGDWYVRPAGVPESAPLASLPQNRIEKILNGCVILENWQPSPTAGGGKSFNIYNARQRRWEQFWVDSAGSAIHFTGGIDADGNMVYISESTGADGQKNMGKMTYFKLGPDSLRQLWETSTDGGKTWTVAFDGVYIRKK